MKIVVASPSGSTSILYSPVLTQRKSEIWRIHLESLIALETTHTNVQRTLRQLELGDIVIKIEDRHARVGIHAYHRPTNLNFGPRARESVQRRSPVVRGRLIVALTRQLLSPPGEN